MFTDESTATQHDQLHKEALWKLQRRALQDGVAAREIARRYADDQCGPNVARDGRHFIQVCDAWLLGFSGGENTWGGGRGGNFARPFRRAWVAGRALRQEFLKP